MECIEKTQFREQEALEGEKERFREH